MSTICHFCSMADECRLSGTNPTESECEREQQRMEEEKDIHHEIIPENGLVSSTENEFIFNDDDEEDDPVSMFETTHPDETCVEYDTDEIDTNDPWYDEADFEDEDEEE